MPQTAFIFVLARFASDTIILSRRQFKTQHMAFQRSGFPWARFLSSGSHPDGRAGQQKPESILPDLSPMHPALFFD